MASRAVGGKPVSAGLMFLVYPAASNDPVSAMPRAAPISRVVSRS
ncbi:hypothetical protein [Mycobacterium sp. OTB74]|nr:hypothetical protein [Mycobacterium sp. OTB74]